MSIRKTSLRAAGAAAVVGGAWMMASAKSPASPTILEPSSATSLPVLAQESHQRVVVLGIDGLDPDILLEAMQRYPERMQNFIKLAADGGGVMPLRTSIPPQSPVAWSNFITGRGPGGHGIFDFIHRVKDTYGIAPGAYTHAEESLTALPGKWQFPAVDGGDSNRSGRAFWTLLGDAGVPADVWRMPINFPVEEARGWSLPGMLTPAVDSAYGEPSFYSTSPPVDAFGNEKFIQITERNGVVRTRLLGPNNSFIEGKPRETMNLDIYVDREAGAVAVEVGTEIMVLEPGEWSKFVPVTFGMLPMGAMDMAGQVRFYLRSIEPELELYASPVNIDPYAPISPVSYPDSAAAEIADEIGRFYTQGMAEDVNALKKHMLTDEEFAQQADLVYRERGRMLDMALDRYMAKEAGGFLFFYYSSVDLAAHMLWRHADESHPHHDADFAAKDSSKWSGREGSTWKDVLMDLYLRMDPVLGKVREEVGDDTLIMVMSDHGFASFSRKFNLNTWLLDEGYLVLKEDYKRELPKSNPEHLPVMIASAVDWSKSRAYGIGFNGLYVNQKGREKQGIVAAGAETDALVAEIKAKLEAILDDAPGREGTRVVLEAQLPADVYSGERMDEAPDLVVGYNSGYGNSDESTQGHIPAEFLEDNLGGTFNGSHLMHPSVVSGTLLTNGKVNLEAPGLEDLTVEILTRYGVTVPKEMDGKPVLQK
ncbi:MAG: putative AlkP superfamily phosphohydrolase/phosphomutase [Planctomycetota bacterium]|jgi:predicted AlkP superfamily phosphohydrolase/phosphomutase